MDGDIQTDDLELSLVGDYDSAALPMALSREDLEEKSAGDAEASEIVDSTTADFIYGEVIDEIPGFDLSTDYRKLGINKGYWVYRNLINKLKWPREDFKYLKSH